MILEFIVDETDYLDFQLYAASKSQRIKKNRLRSKLIVPIVYLAFGIFLLFIDKLIVSYVFMLGAVTWFFVYPFWERKRYVKHYQRYITENFKGKLNRKAIIEFNDDCITAKDEGNESKIMNTEIEMISEIPSSIFIKLKSGQSVIIPKRKNENIALLISKLNTLASSLNVSYLNENDWIWK